MKILRHSGAVSQAKVIELGEKKIFYYGFHAKNRIFHTKVVKYVEEIIKFHKD